jgi:predicted lactoylglutathione lyase
VEQRVSIITLGVEDLRRSREFNEALGWRRSGGNDDIVFFRAGGMAVALYPRHDLAKDVGVDAEGSGFKGVTIAYNGRNRAEVDDVLSEAVAAGGQAGEAGAEAFWGGYSGYFIDPDGFVWEVAWNPFIPIAADGSIVVAG